MIIDPQNDFCTPQGSLFVDGAVEDMQRLATFIKNKSEELAEIVISLDWHQPFAIFHPSFWTDENGNNPTPYTQITSSDVKTKKWTPKISPVTVETYLQELEESGEYLHLIWPEHCIAGTQGAAVCSTIETAVREWANTGKTYKTILKGTNKFAEFFGVFKAQVSIPGMPVS